MSRLIDADALSKKLGKVWGIPEDWDGDMNPICEDAFTLIDDAPTIEAVPVVHGKWIKTCDGVNLNVNTWRAETKFIYGCNVCGYTTGNQGGRFKYCPNCGADMRKGGTE